MHPTWDETESFQWAKSKLQVNPNVVLGIMEKRETWQEMVGRIKCPGLLITADTSSGARVTQETASEAAGIWKKCKVVHIPGAGHNIRREQFELYLAEVKAFLKEYAPY